jgi:uroporphyrinogen-III synthase
MTNNPKTVMTNHDPLILLTRPLDASRAFANKINARLPSAKIAVHPLQSITFMDRPADFPKDIAAYVFTSAHGVEAAKKWGVSSRPCYAVGSRTARAALSISDKVFDANGTAKDLMKLLVQFPAKGPVLYVRGAHVSTDLTQVGKDHNLAILDTVGYEQTQCSPSPDFQNDLKQGGKPIILPLFSARSAALLLAQAQPQLDWHIIAMSQKVAEIFDPKQVKTIDVAIRPDGPSMESAVCHAWQEYCID